MCHALERLRLEKIHHRQTSEFQIKVGPYNFYPNSGTIFMDRDSKARPERGLDDFIAIVGKLRVQTPHRFRHNAPAEPRPPRRSGFDIEEAMVIELKLPSALQNDET
jgi:hypothetical protein